MKTSCWSSYNFYPSLQQWSTGCWGKVAISSVDRRRAPWVVGRSVYIYPVGSSSSLITSSNVDLPITKHSSVVSTLHWYRGSILPLDVHWSTEQVWCGGLDQLFLNNSKLVITMLTCCLHNNYINGYHSFSTCTNSYCCVVVIRDIYSITHLYPTIKTLFITNVLYMYILYMCRKWSVYFVTVV